MKYRKGMYVRAHGHIRSFDGHIAMHCFKIRPITDFNEVQNTDRVVKDLVSLLTCQVASNSSAESVCHAPQVTYHSLQCIFQHLHFTKGNNAAGGAGPTSASKPVCMS